MKMTLKEMAVEIVYHTASVNSRGGEITVIRRDEDEFEIVNKKTAGTLEFSEDPSEPEGKEGWQEWEEARTDEIREALEEMEIENTDWPEEDITIELDAQEERWGETTEDSEELKRNLLATVKTAYPAATVRWGEPDMVIWAGTVAQEKEIRRNVDDIWIKIIEDGV